MKACIETIKVSPDLAVTCQRDAEFCGFRPHGATVVYSDTTTLHVEWVWRPTPVPVGGHANPEVAENGPSRGWATEAADEVLSIVSGINFDMCDDDSEIRESIADAIIAAWNQRSGR